jgi:protein involved in polysaccharide export with SLBB domain
MALCFPSFYRVLAASSLLTLQTACEGLKDSGQVPPPRLPAAGAVAKSTEIVFAAGDSVELFVEEDKSFNGVFEVREGGYVLIPKIGRVMVAGLNRDAAEKRIREDLQKQQLRQATVFVEHIPGAGRAAGGLTPGTGLPRMTIFLTGAVARPGQHAVPMPSVGRPPGLFETLLMAGGLAKFSDDTRVRIMRLNDQGLRTPLMVDVRQIRDGLIPDVPIGDGDIIQVPEKIFGF